MPIPCVDCETELTTSDGLCRSCREHRADNHPPQRYTENPNSVWGGWYCHGAGPNGIDMKKLIATRAQRRLVETF